MHRDSCLERCDREVWQWIVEHQLHRLDQRQRYLEMFTCVGLCLGETRAGITEDRQTPAIAAASTSAAANSAALASPASNWPLDWKAIPQHRASTPLGRTTSNPALSIRASAISVALRGVMSSWPIPKTRVAQDGK